MAARAQDAQDAENRMASDSEDEHEREGLMEDDDDVRPRRRRWRRRRSAPWPLGAASSGDGLRSSCVRALLCTSVISSPCPIRAAARAGGAGARRRRGQPPAAALLPAPHPGARAHDGARWAAGAARLPVLCTAADAQACHRAMLLPGGAPALEHAATPIAHARLPALALRRRRRRQQRRPGAEPEAGRRDPEVLCVPPGVATSRRLVVPHCTSPSSCCIVVLIC